MLSFGYPFLISMMILIFVSGVIHFTSFDILNGFSFYEIAKGILQYQRFQLVANLQSLANMQI